MIYSFYVINIIIWYALLYIIFYNLIWYLLLATCSASIFIFFLANLFSDSLVIRCGQVTGVWLVRCEQMWHMPLLGLVDEALPCASLLSLSAIIIWIERIPQSQRSMEPQDGKGLDPWMTVWNIGLPHTSCRLHWTVTWGSNSIYCAIGIHGYNG